VLAFAVSKTAEKRVERNALDKVPMVCRNYDIGDYETIRIRTATTVAFVSLHGFSIIVVYIVSIGCTRNQSGLLGGDAACWAASD
jgi:hypothetical protein